MEKVNKVLYESKLIGYPKPWKNKVRTFCQNPGGFVAQENYDNDLAVVNGHSYKEKKSPNTNLAILVSHNFTEPFNQPIAYAQKVGELTNMLGAGHIMVQRYGDILDGKRTWQKELAQSNVKPTLKAVSYTHLDVYKRQVYCTAWWSRCRSSWSISASTCCITAPTWVCPCGWPRC